MRLVISINFFFALIVTVKASVFFMSPHGVGRQVTITEGRKKVIVWVQKRCHLVTDSVKITKIHNDKFLVQWLGRMNATANPRFIVFVKSKSFPVKSVLGPSTINRDGNLDSRGTPNTYRVILEVVTSNDAKNLVAELRGVSKDMGTD